MAGGQFAPGHLGELTQLAPFEMIDEALSATGAVQSRLRDPPSRVVVYLVLAACLFPETGYLGVWRKLTGSLVGLPVAAPTASALAQARRRVGSKPLRWLFDLLRGPAATRHGPGSRWRGLLVVALDGTTLTVPDTPVLTRFTKQAGNHGGTGYPQVRLLALVACGTRTLIDAVFGPTTAGETTYAPPGPRSCRRFRDPVRTTGPVAAGNTGLPAAGRRLGAAPRGRTTRPACRSEVRQAVDVTPGNTVPVPTRSPLDDDSSPTGHRRRSTGRPLQPPSRTGN
ncbi:transposase domain-containing protein [Streptomyces sp. NPDC012474]|uniref:transposase domain-containing protein n=1 Tax=Streptomyces sp. NPDC012474 TaxID=3364836 RepID=UPI0036E63D24